MTDAIEIALTSDDNDQLNSIAAWDTRNGTQILQYRGGGAVAKGTLNIIKDKFIVAANSMRPLLYIWPINNSDTIHNVKFVLPAKVNCLNVSNDGNFLIGGIKENIYIWQVCTGKMLTMLLKHYQQVNCLKFTDDGSHFVSGGEDGQVIIWSLSEAIGDRLKPDSIEPLHSFSDHALPVTDLWIGCGGLSAILMTASKDKTCQIYDMASGTILISLVFQEIITAITLDRVECNLFVGTSLGNIYNHRLQPPSRTREYHITDADKVDNKFNGHTKTITCLSLSLDEQSLMSGSEDTNVIIWNIPSRSILKKIPHKGAITNAIFIPTMEVIFDIEVNLQLPIKNFQRMISNIDTDEEESIEVMHKNNLFSFVDETDNYQFMIKNKTSLINFKEKQKPCTNMSKENSDESNLLFEIERLKKINKELFHFNAKNIMKSN